MYEFFLTFIPKFELCSKEKKNIILTLQVFYGG